MGATSIYYAPKVPLSIPLFNPSNNCYTLVFDDSEVDIPADLFFKLYKQQNGEIPKAQINKNEHKPTISEFIKANYTQEELDAEANQIRDKMVNQIRFAKMMGFTREMFLNQMKNDPITNSFKKNNTLDYMIALTNQIWDEVEHS